MHMILFHVNILWNYLNRARINLFSIDSQAVFIFLGVLKKPSSL